MYESKPNPAVHPKIASKWMFIPPVLALKVLIHSHIQAIMKVHSGRLGMRMETVEDRPHGTFFSARALLDADAAADREGRRQDPFFPGG